MEDGGKEDLVAFIGDQVTDEEVSVALPFKHPRLTEIRGEEGNPSGT